MTMNKGVAVRLIPFLYGFQPLLPDLVPIKASVLLKPQKQCRMHEESAIVSSTMKWTKRAIESCMSSQRPGTIHMGLEFEVDRIEHNIWIAVGPEYLCSSHD